MKKILLTGLFATVAGALVFGAAASLMVNSNDLGSGSDDVVSCDESVDVSYGVDPADFSRVDTITVSDIDDVACDGQTVYLTVSDGLGIVIHTDSDLVTSASVDFAVDLAASDIEDVAVTITG